MAAPNPDAIDRDATAEAFNAWWTRGIVTAGEGRWLDAAVQSFCGYGTSVIGCDAEAAIERRLDPEETPDGRPGAAVMAFAFRSEALAAALANRLGQTLLTCPTVAVFDGLPDASKRGPLGDHLRYFGDGHEAEQAGVWRIPVMAGDVELPRTIGLARGVAGGNLVIGGGSRPRGPDPALRAAAAAADAIARLPGVITPFPGGVCRSGSKAGSRYRGLIASTNEAYCPTLRDQVETRLPEGIESVYEVIINGENETAVRASMRVGIQAAIDAGAAWVSACEYGGKLGRVRIPLHELVDSP
ncbi:MAG: formylmethanofuran--tetrahydromethanopterin N-formyltransferase [Planctomycetota bacterium]